MRSSLTSRLWLSAKYAIVARKAAFGDAEVGKRREKNRRGREAGEDASRASKGEDRARSAPESRPLGRGQGPRTAAESD